MTSEATSIRSKIAIGIILAYAILFLPFWQALVIGGVLGSSIHYAVRKIKTRYKITGKKFEWSFITALFVGVGFLFYQLTVHVFHMLQPVDGRPSVFTQVSDSFDKLNVLIGRWATQLLGTGSVSAESIESAVNNTLTQLQTGILGAIQRVIGNLPELLLGITFTVLVAVYFSIGTPKWLQRYSPIRTICKSSPISWEEFESICATSVGSLLLIGFVQASIIAGACAYIGTPNIPLIFTGTFLLSFIPLLGAGSVPFVMMIYYYSAGDMNSALVMLIAFGIGSTIDNIVRAAMFSKLSNNNAVISFFAVIGSIFLFGLPGLLIAPVLEQLAARVIPELQRRQSVPQSILENAVQENVSKTSSRKQIARNQEVFR